MFNYQFTFVQKIQKYLKKLEDTRLTLKTVHVILIVKEGFKYKGWQLCMIYKYSFYIVSKPIENI